MNEMLSPASGQCDAKMAVRPSILDGLRRQRDALTEQLANVTAAIKKLEDNPAVAETLESIAKVGGLRY